MLGWHHKKKISKKKGRNSRGKYLIVNRKFVIFTVTPKKNRSVACEVPQDTSGGVSGIFVWISGWTGPIPFVAEISSWAGSARKFLFRNLGWTCSSRFQGVKQSASVLSRPNSFCCQVEPAQPKLISRAPRNVGSMLSSRIHYFKKIEVSRSKHPFNLRLSRYIYIYFFFHLHFHVESIQPESFDVFDFGLRHFQSNLYS